MDSAVQIPEISELVFEKTEFDTLEENLRKPDIPGQVFKVAADWIVKRFNPSFVFFTADGQVPGEYIRYSVPEDTVPVSILYCIDERRKASAAGAAVYLHASGCVSIPFRYTGSVTGCLFIGPRTDGNKKYTGALLKKLNPMARILSRTLLSLESDRLYQEKNRLQDAFSRYVSPDIVKKIMENKSVIQLGGEKRCLTAIFTDLQGFTSLSEKMDSSALVRALNMYLNEMTQVIIALGGTIDKFEGDAIVAFFGAPNRIGDHAVRCCLAALRMKKMEALLNEQLLREKLIPMPFITRMGINTGDMIVGNVGSLQRIDYTVIGSNVNIAARLENANKRYNTSIMISSSTFRNVGSFFRCQYVDTAYLKGVRDPVALYELQSERPGAVPEYCNYVNAHPEEVYAAGLLPQI